MAVDQQFMRVSFVLSEQASWVARGNNRILIQALCHWMTVQLFHLGLCFTICKSNKPEGPFPALTLCDSTLNYRYSFVFLHCILGKDVEGSFSVKPDFWKLRFGCLYVNWFLLFHGLANPHISTQILKPVDYGFKLNQNQVSAITRLRVLFRNQLQ